MKLENYSRSYLRDYRSKKYVPTKFPVGVDIFAYTESEIKTMVEEGNFFVKRALDEGIIICERFC